MEKIHFIGSPQIKEDASNFRIARALPFQPALGLSSPHLQTILTCITPSGLPPPSNQLLIPLEDGDFLCCEISSPPSWTPTQATIALIHGLGGSHNSGYMVRLSRKLYEEGYRVVRVNLRSCGSGSKYANRPYHGGLSADIYEFIYNLKILTPTSPIILIGFSLGGNIALKLVAELGEKAFSLLSHLITVCAPIDLKETAEMLTRPSNLLYNRYYMHQLGRQADRWLQGRTFSNIYEFDEIVTAPQWGFQNASDYYQKSSSRTLLPKITLSCNVLFAADDPFINYRSCLDVPLPQNIKVWLAPYGGHMGFFGKSDERHGYFWLDGLLLKWIEENLRECSQTSIR